MLLIRFFLAILKSVFLGLFPVEYDVEIGCVTQYLRGINFVRQLIVPSSRSTPFLSSGGTVLVVASINIGSCLAPLLLANNVLYLADFRL